MGFHFAPKADRVTLAAVSFDLTRTTTVTRAHDEFLADTSSDAWPHDRRTARLTTLQNAGLGTGSTPPVTPIRRARTGYAFDRTSGDTAFVIRSFNNDKPYDAFCSNRLLAMNWRITNTRTRSLPSWPTTSRPASCGQRPTARSRTSPTSCPTAPKSSPTNAGLRLSCPRPDAAVRAARPRQFSR